MRFRLIALALAMAGTVASQTHRINTVAGGGLPENIPALSASLGSVSGVAVDATGNVYFSLPDYNVVMRRDTEGKLTRVAGDGTFGSSGDGGPATSAQLGGPAGIAFDSSGDLYIADSKVDRIRKVSNGVITTVAGSAAGRGYSGDDGPATSAQLNTPSGVAVDSAGILYIADTGNRRVRKVSNGVIATFAGNGIQGYSGDDGPATSAQLAMPASVAVDSAGSLYIADRNAHRIRKVSSGVITTFVGDGTSTNLGDGGPAAGATVGFPACVAVDSAGGLYITSPGAVRKVSGGLITKVAGGGPLGYSGDGGPATDAQFNGVQGVSVDSAGVFYIADQSNSRVRKVSNGVVTTIAGNGATRYGGDDGPATSAQLAAPAGVAVDSAGNLYIADSAGHQIRKVSNGVITTVAGSGIRGRSGDGGPATSAQLAQPAGVAVDSTGNLYIADSGNHTVRKVSEGIITTIAGTGTQGYSGDGGTATSAALNSPVDVEVDAAGSLYISDELNHRVRKVANGGITTVAGNGSQGYGGDDGPADLARLSRPQGLAVDSDGNLYIADSNNRRLRKVSNGTITTVAGDGTNGWAADGTPATSAQLPSIGSVAVDSAGRLYIGAYGPIFRVSLGLITKIAGGGTSFGDNGFANSATLNGVRGLAADASGKVYLSDTMSQRVRVLTPTLATVSAASFTPFAPLAPGVIGAAFGENLAPAVAVAPATGPLPNDLAGRRVQFKDSTGSYRDARLWFVSPGQINFAVPGDTALGPATVSVFDSESKRIAICDVQINAVAPGLFTMNTDGRGVPAALAIFVKPGSPQTWQYVFNTGCAVGSCQPVPLDLGAATDQVILQLYGTGIRGRSSLAAVTATIGGVDAPVEYAGPVSGMTGLDQVNVPIPRSLIGRGEVDIALTVDGKTANSVRVNIR